MSTNAKLLAWLGGLVLVGAGLLGGLSLAGGSGVGGPFGMDHGTGSGDDTGAAGQLTPADPAPDRTTAREVLVATAGPEGAGETVAEQLAQVPGVARVDRYLTGALPDGTRLVGLDLQDAPLITPDGKVLDDVRVTVGREPSEVGKDEPPPAFVGRVWAQDNESIYGYQIAGMITSHPAPVQLADDSQVTVVDVVDTGDAQADNSVFVPLAVAQQLLDGVDARSLVAVGLDEGADQAAVRAAVEAAGLRPVDEGSK